ncbi:MAG: helix-turn-helix domain-containing protein [Clostridiaceae bacterium]|nr:helix-turn-helix domain-containing protein [Clostridiaceae bacterium]
MDYITTKEAARKWGISVRRVQVLCETGKIKGITRFGQVWAIPADSPKPVDCRFRKNRQLEK